MPHASDDGAPQATGLESRIAVLIDEIKKQLLRIEDDEGTLAEMTPDEELPAATLRAGCNEEVRLAAGNATHISVEVSRRTHAAPGDAFRPLTGRLKTWPATLSSSHWMRLLTTSYATWYVSPRTITGACAELAARAGTLQQGRKLADNRTAPLGLHWWQEDCDRAALR
jgi:hypothetical protein